jgi:hypothetical protein
MGGIVSSVARVATAATLAVSKIDLRRLVFSRESY